jgi:simple sugar transport system ATP-binding protein
MGILVISDDIPELVNTCNRVLVVRSGRIQSELRADGLSEQALLAEIAA